MVLLGCEVFPKTLAVRRPEHWALRVAWLMFVFEKGPSRSTALRKPEHRHLRRAASPSATSARLTDAEYQELLEMALQQGTLAETEKEIILQIISLDQRVARDVMRPRASMAP